MVHGFISLDVSVDVGVDEFEELFVGPGAGDEGDESLSDGPTHVFSQGVNALLMFTYTFQQRRVRPENVLHHELNKQ